MVNLYQVNFDKLELCFSEVLDQHWPQDTCCVRSGRQSEAEAIYLLCSVSAGDQALLQLTHAVTHLLAHTEIVAAPTSAGSLPSAYSTPGPDVFSSVTAHTSLSCPTPHIIKAGGLEVTKSLFRF